MVTSQTPYAEIIQLLEEHNFQDLEKKISEADLSMEPFFIDILPDILLTLTNTKTSIQGKKIGELIIQKMNPFSMKIYMDVLYENMNSMKWQVKKGALMLLGLFAKHQKEVVKFNLPNMILRLIDMASDVKRDLQEQTRIWTTYIAINCNTAIYCVTTLIEKGRQQGVTSRPERIHRVSLNLNSTQQE